MRSEPNLSLIPKEICLGEEPELAWGGVGGGWLAVAASVGCVGVHINRENSGNS